MLAIEALEIGQMICVLGVSMIGVSRIDVFDISVYYRTICRHIHILRLGLASHQLLNLQADSITHLNRRSTTSEVTTTCQSMLGGIKAIVETYRVRISNPPALWESRSLSTADCMMSPSSCRLNEYLSIMAAARIVATGLAMPGFSKVSHSPSILPKRDGLLTFASNVGGTAMDGLV